MDATKTARGPVLQSGANTRRTSSFSRHGIDRATMTGRTIDGTVLRIALQVLHLCKLLIDHPVHRGHFTGGALGSLVVAREILFDVTMQARHTERPAVAGFHDCQQQRRASGLQVLNVLESLAGRLVLVPSDAFRPLFHETRIRVGCRLPGNGRRNEKEKRRDHGSFCFHGVMSGAYSVPIDNSHQMNENAMARHQPRTWGCPYPVCAVPDSDKVLMPECVE